MLEAGGAKSKGDYSQSGQRAHPLTLQPHQSQTLAAGVRRGPDFEGLLLDAVLADAEGLHSKPVAPAIAPPGALNPSPLRPSLSRPPRGSSFGADASPPVVLGLASSPVGDGDTATPGATAAPGPQASCQSGLAMDPEAQLGWSTRTTSEPSTPPYPSPCVGATAGAGTGVSTGAAPGGFVQPTRTPAAVASPDAESRDAVTAMSSPVSRAPSSTAATAAAAAASPFSPKTAAQLLGSGGVGGDDGGVGVSAKVSAAADPAATASASGAPGVQPQGGSPAPSVTAASVSVAPSAFATNSSSAWRAVRSRFGFGAGPGTGTAGGSAAGSVVGGKTQGSVKSGAALSKLSELTGNLQREMENNARGIAKLSPATRAWLSVNKYGAPLTRGGARGAEPGAEGSEADLDVSLGDISLGKSTSTGVSGYDRSEHGRGGGEDDDAAPGCRSVLAHLRARLWRLMTDPESSSAAYAISMLVLVAILVSTIAFCLETVPAFSAERSPAADNAFNVIELVVVQLFAADYLLRLASCPRLLAFLVDPLNIIDLISVVPWYVELALADSGMQGTAVFRVLRLLRVFRVLKLGARYRKLLVVTSALSRSLDMLVLMAFFVALTVVVAATLMYFAERGSYDAELGYYVRKDEKYIIDYDHPIVSPFESIPAGFWWAIVTLMTVGYGDVLPLSPGGRIIAAATMLCGILSIALPVAVIGTNFSSEWEASKKAAAAAKAAAADGGGAGLAAAAAGPAPGLRALRRSLRAHVTTAEELGEMLQEAVTRMADLQSGFRDQGALRVGEVETLLRPTLVAAAQAAELAAARAAAAAVAGPGGGGGGGDANSSGQRRRRVDTVASAREVVALLAKLGLGGEAQEPATAAAAAGAGPGAVHAAAAAVPAPVAEATEGEEGAKLRPQPSPLSPRAALPHSTSRLAFPDSTDAASAPASGDVAAAPASGVHVRMYGRVRGADGGGGGPALGAGGGGASRSWKPDAGAGAWGSLELLEPEARSDTADELRAALRTLRGTPLHARMLEEVGEALGKEAEAERLWRQLEQVLRSCQLMSAGHLPDLTDLMRSQCRQLGSLGRESSSLRARLAGLEEELLQLEAALERSGLDAAQDPLARLVSPSKRALMPGSRSASASKLPSRCDSYNGSRRGGGGGGGGAGGGGDMPSFAEGDADGSHGEGSLGGGRASGGWMVGGEGGAAARGTGVTAAVGPTPPPRVLVTTAAASEVAAAAALPVGSPTGAAATAAAAAVGMAAESSATGIR